MSKRQKVQCRRVSHARHVCDTLCSRSQMIDWGTCWSKLSQLTNHRIGLPERRIENDAYRFYYTVSPQPPRGFRATFLDALSSRPSWSLKLPQFGRGISKKNVRISPTISLYYSAFGGNKFPWLNDFVVFQIRVWMHEINSLGSISVCVRTYIALSDANRRPYGSTKGTGQDSYNPHWINSNWSAYIRESNMKKSKQWLNRRHNLLNT